MTANVSASSSPSVASILAERLAKGEISEDEYDRLVAKLVVPSTADSRALDADAEPVVTATEAATAADVLMTRVDALKTLAVRFAFVMPWLALPVAWIYLWALVRLWRWSGTGEPIMEGFQSGWGGPAPWLPLIGVGLGVLIASSMARETVDKLFALYAGRRLFTDDGWRAYRNERGELTDGISDVLARVNAYLRESAAWATVLRLNPAADGRTVELSVKTRLWLLVATWLVAFFLIGLVSGGSLQRQV